MSDKKNKNLKPGWRPVKFGDVVRLSKARSQDPLADGFERYVGLEHLEPSDLRIRSWGNVADGVTFTNVFRPGQVLFGKRRAYQRKVAVAHFSGVCSGDIYVLESKDATVLLPNLLPFICQSDEFFERAIDTSAGSLSPRTNWSSLSEFVFALPKLDEQIRICKALESAKYLLDSSREALGACSQLIRAIREEHFRSLNRSYMRQLNDAVCSSAYGPRFAASMYRESGTVKSLRTTDMPAFGVIAHDTAPFADIPAEMVAEHRLEEGDFLISRTGFTSGRAATFRSSGPTDEISYIPAAFIVRLRLDARKLVSDYLVEYIQSSKGWSTIRRLQRGTQQLNISASALVAERVPMPDVDAQELFLERQRDIYRAQTACEQRVRAAGRLLKSISVAALNGAKE